MTLILGLEHRGRVHLTGDRISVDASDCKRVVRTEKVFRVGQWIIGVAGCWRALSLFKFKLRAPKIDSGADIERLANVDLMDSIRNLLTAEGYDNSCDPESKDTKWEMLAGAKGHLYTLDSEGSIWRTDDGIAAIGHAGGAAAAVAATAAQRPIGRPERVLRKSMGLAADGCADVSGPFDYLTE